MAMNTPTVSCAEADACRECALRGRECELRLRCLETGRDGGMGAGSVVTVRIRRKACSRSWTDLASRVKVLDRQSY